MKFAIAAAALVAAVSGPAFAQPPVEIPATVTTTVVEAPAAKASVEVQTLQVETPTTTVETTTEVITPVSDRPELDANNPIAPEVQAVVEAKVKYTTADIAKAQLDAVLATPVSTPTTTITTTVTTPKIDG